MNQFDKLYEQLINRFSDVLTESIKNKQNNNMLKLAKYL